MHSLEILIFVLSNSYLTCVVTANLFYFQHVKTVVMFSTVMNKKCLHSVVVMGMGWKMLFASDSFRQYKCVCIGRFSCLQRFLLVLKRKEKNRLQFFCFFLPVLRQVEVTRDDTSAASLHSQLDDLTDSNIAKQEKIEKR